MSNTSVQLVWRESVKQPSTTPLNSFQQRQNMAGPVHRETAREKFNIREHPRACETRIHTLQSRHEAAVGKIPASTFTVFFFFFTFKVKLSCAFGLQPGTTPQAQTSGACQKPRENPTGTGLLQALYLHSLSCCRVGLQVSGLFLRQDSQVYWVIYSS